MGNSIILSLFASLLLLASCDNTDDLSQLNLNITGLEDLGDDFAYEGWVGLSTATQFPYRHLYRGRRQRLLSRNKSLT
ncbi:MAG: hypothetical protein R3B47_16025 [Bacteroidia bacterium]